MTREELAAAIAGCRELLSWAGDSDGIELAQSRAIAQLADERDAAIAQRDEALAQRANGKAVLVPTDELARIKAQRDRALALLRDEMPADCTTKGYLTGIGGVGVRKCSLREPCWGCRRRALLAEVDG